MPLGLRYAFVSRLLPQNLAGFFIQGQNLPLVRRAVGHRVGIAIEPRAKSLFGVARDGRCYEHAIAPHHWRRIGQSRNLAVQTMLVPLDASQCTGGFAPSPTPEAPGPRNCSRSAAIAA